MEIINTGGAPAAIGPYSQAVKTDNMLFVSGQIPIDPSTGELVENDEKQTDKLVAYLVYGLFYSGLSPFAYI